LIPQPRHIPSLDGFRAIAVCLVIGSHVIIGNPISSNVDTYLKHLTLGGVGVRIFFVISGFLITYLLLLEKSSTGRVNLMAFFARRILRIFPAFYFYLVVLNLLNWYLNLQIPDLLFLSAALYIHNFELWGSNWFVNHTWSLGVEEQFYLLWPFIFIRINKLEKPLIWIIVLAVGSLMRALHYKYPDEADYFLAPFFMHADFLFSGCFIAYSAFYDGDKILKLVHRARPALVYLAILCILGFSIFEFHPHYDKFFILTSGAMINICICFLVVYFIFNKNSAGFRFLNFPLVTFIGKLSYSLYIWQQLFLSNSGFWFSEFPQNIFLNFLVAFGSYKVVEKPFLNLKERFRP
jgi:peptidoglycan/LPS O-acetylase OafA/YrhL